MSGYYAIQNYFRMCAAPLVFTNKVILSDCHSKSLIGGVNWVHDIFLHARERFSTSGFSSNAVAVEFAGVKCDTEVSPHTGLMIIRSTLPWLN